MRGTRKEFFFQSHTIDARSEKRLWAAVSRADVGETKQQGHAYAAGKSPR
jgi:hypothetical protein